MCQDMPLLAHPDECLAAGCVKAVVSVTLETSVEPIGLNNSGELPEDVCVLAIASTVGSIVCTDNIPP